jgi:hypothetical protein
MIQILDESLKGVDSKSKGAIEEQKSSPSLFDSILDSAISKEGVNESLENSNSNISSKESSLNQSSMFDSIVNSSNGLSRASLPTNSSMFDSIIESKEPIIEESLNTQIANTKSSSSATLTMFDSMLGSSNSLATSSMNSNSMEKSTLASSTMFDSSSDSKVNLNSSSVDDINTPALDSTSSMFDSIISDSSVNLNSSASSMLDPIVSHKNALEGNSKDFSSLDLKSKQILVEQARDVELGSVKVVGESTNILNSATSSKDIYKAADLLNLNMRSLDSSYEDEKGYLVKESDKSNLSSFSKELESKGSKISTLLNQDSTKVSNVSLDAINIKDDTKVKDNSFSIDNGVVKLKVSKVKASSDFTELIHFAKDGVVELKEKIVDSKQRVEQFMSDLAKNLAKDYKPPYTTLKISLAPEDLGNIDVVIRGSKSKASIFFQSSQVAHDLLSANQNELRTALLRQFGGEQMFTLNFSSSSSNEQNSLANSNQQNQKEQQSQKDEEPLDEEVVTTEEESSSGVYI